MFDIGQPAPQKSPPVGLAPKPPLLSPVVAVTAPLEVVKVVHKPAVEPPVPGTFLGDFTLRVDRKLQPLFNLGAPLLFVAGAAFAAGVCAAAGSIASLGGYNGQPFYDAIEAALPVGVIGLPAAMVFIRMRAEVVRARFRAAGRIVLPSGR